MEALREGHATNAVSQRKPTRARKQRTVQGPPLGGARESRGRILKPTLVEGIFGPDARKASRILEKYPRRENTAIERLSSGCCFEATLPDGAGGRPSRTSASDTEL